MNLFAYDLTGPTEIQTNDVEKEYDLEDLIDPFVVDLADFRDFSFVMFMPTGIELISDELKVRTVIVARKKLPPHVKREVKDYCSGQYSDGWGEGYEQFDHRVKGVFVAPWFPHQKLTLSAARPITENELNDMQCYVEGEEFWSTL